MRKTPDTSRPAAQRDALKRSEKKAAERQPENFKDAETEDKIVEIGPDPRDAPIEGIDPPQARPTQRAEKTSTGEEDPGAALDDPDVRDAMQREEAQRIR